MVNNEVPSVISEHGTPCNDIDFFKKIGITPHMNYTWVKVPRMQKCS